MNNSELKVIFSDGTMISFHVLESSNYWKYDWDQNFKNYDIGSQRSKFRKLLMNTDIYYNFFNKKIHIKKEENGYVNDIEIMINIDNNSNYFYALMKDNKFYSHIYENVDDFINFIRSDNYFKKCNEYEKLDNTEQENTEQKNTEKLENIQQENTGRENIQQENTEKLENTEQENIQQENIQQEIILPHEKIINDLQRENQMLRDTNKILLNDIEKLKFQRDELIEINSIIINENSENHNMSSVLSKKLSEKINQKLQDIENKIKEIDSEYRNNDHDNFEIDEFMNNLIFYQGSKRVKI